MHAVRDVSFALKAGEILALIGPNGAGKTTCFDMLNGQTIPDAGRIHLLGENIAGGSRARSGGSASAARSRSPRRSRR